jgi:outer membrane receptor protein involved in Fe transport
MSDLIDTRATGSTEDGVSLLEYVNVTDAHSAGLNATLSLEELPGDIALQGNYAFLPVSHDLAGGKRLALRSVHSGRLEIRREFFGEQLEICGDASTRSELSVPDGAVAAPAYALLGFGVQYRPLEIHLTVDANNLIDQSNATWGPKPGFNLMATLEVRYEAPDSDESPAGKGRGDPAIRQ